MSVSNDWTNFCFTWRNSPQWARASSFTRFLDHAQRRTTGCRTPPDEWSAGHRDLYLYNTQHSQQTIIHVPGGIRTHNLSRRAAADPRLRPRGNWDRQTNSSYIYNANIHPKGRSWAGVNVTGHAGPSDRISETPGLTSFWNWRKTRWRTEGGIEEDSVWDVPLLPHL